MAEENLTFKSEAAYNRDVGGNVEPGLNFGHVLSNMDEFRTAAMHFNEFKRYTNYPESTYENSGYMKFWKEEKRRCLEGYDIGRDWIPGYYYWYLNYSPIIQVKYDEKDAAKLKEGKRIRGERFVGFPRVWDYDYYYFHYLEEAEKDGKHASVLKSRGKGYSFKGASMCCRNYFLIPQSKSFIFASDRTFLDGGDGIMNKVVNIKEFVNVNTAFFKHSQKKNTSMQIRASRVEKIKGKEIEKGYMSEIIAKTLKNNPDGARGVRGKLVLWEEAGEFPELLKAWQIAQESVSQDDVGFGLMIAFGTGGSKMTSFRTLNELFNKPNGYGIHEIPNIWSLKKRKNKTGFFVPSYSNIMGYTDRDGNTEIQGAYEAEEGRIERMELAGVAASSVLQKKAERPKRPEEALLRKDSSIFPIQKIMDRIGDLDTSDILESRYIGRMIVNSEGKVDFVIDKNKFSLDMFPLESKDNVDGAIVLYEKPYKVGDEIPNNLYIAGTDPYDHDKSTTDSLGSTFIMNRVTGMIVASYIGRPRKASMYHEQVRLLLLFYNAKCNFENNLLGMKEYFEKRGSLHLLAKDLQLYKKTSKHSKVDREYGTPGTTGVNKYGRELIKGYLEDKVFKDEELEFINTIKDIGLLRELRDWNIEDNFDRVSAFGMLMLYYQEMSNFEVPSYSGEDDRTDVGDDPFWDAPLGFDEYED